MTAPVPLLAAPFMSQIVPCKLCKKKMKYEGPCVDPVMTYHAYICPCGAVSCAAVTQKGGPVQWLDLIQ